MEYYVEKPLTDELLVKSAAEDLMIFSEDTYQDMESSIKRIYGRSRWHLWWD